MVSSMRTRPGLSCSTLFFQHLAWYVANRCSKILVNKWTFRIVTCCHFSPFNNFTTLEKLLSSVQFSRSVVSDSLRSHESQHARPPCPSPTPGVHSDSHPSSQWCHLAISSSVIPFSSCPQSLPASKSFPMSQLFAWGGQSTGVSALASFLPKKS